MTEWLHFLRTKNWSRLSRITYFLLPGLEKYCVNLDSLKYLKMVILSLPHLIFSKITVLVPYITVFRIPGRLFIYLPELFICDPWMKLECKRECPFTQNSKVQLKEWPLRSLDMGRERKRWKSTNTWKQRCRLSSPLGSHRPSLKKSIQFSSVAQSCLTLCNPMDCSTPASPVCHQFPKLAQTHVHGVSDAIQPSHPLLSPSTAFNFPSIRVFSNESVLCIRWSKYWSFNICPSNELSGLISFRIDWFDLLAL